MDDVGKLRHRVTWQAPRPSAARPGQGGQPTPAYDDRGTFWDCVEPLRGFELFQAVQIKAETAFRITMRAVGPIGPKDRLRFEATGRLFEIVSVYRDMERNAYLTIAATEIT